MCDYGYDSAAFAFGDCEYDEYGWFCDGMNADGQYWFCLGDQEDYWCDEGLDGLAWTIGDCVEDENGWFCEYVDEDEQQYYFCMGDDEGYWCEDGYDTAAKVFGDCAYGDDEYGSWSCDGEDNGTPWHCEGDAFDYYCEYGGEPVWQKAHWEWDDMQRKIRFTNKLNLQRGMMI